MKREDYPQMCALLRATGALADDVYHQALHVRDHRLNNRTTAADIQFAKLIMDAGQLYDSAVEAFALYLDVPTKEEVHASYKEILSAAEQRQLGTI